MRRSAPLILVVLLVLAGCSSHEERFEHNAPPPPAFTQDADLSVATGALLTSLERQLTVLPPDALAPLTSAAALSFKSSGSPLTLRLARLYGNTLIGARVGGAFFSRESGGRPDPEMTAVAGMAMLDAYSVTRDERFATAARRAAGAMTTSRLGWVQDGPSASVRERAAPRRPAVALTALAFLLLGRAANELQMPTAKEARSALLTLSDSQAAVGRWYAYTDGTHPPMRLDQWGQTLLALTALPWKTAQGIAGAGVPAMFQEAFHPSGRLREGTFTHEPGKSGGIALAVLAQAGGGPADRAFQHAPNLIDDRGTVKGVSSSDFTARAWYAVALARRQSQVTAQDHK
jgi:hypothetical protein